MTTPTKETRCTRCEQDVHDGSTGGLVWEHGLYRHARPQQCIDALLRALNVARQQEPTR